MNARTFRRLAALPDWNVVVSVHEHSYAWARQFLADYGLIAGTEFHNVLVMKLTSVERFLSAIAPRWQAEQEVATHIARIAPMTATFDFQTSDEFEARAQEAVAPWARQLAGKTFHVRMHRRGLKGILSSQREERLLDELLLATLKRAGASGAVRFEEADAVIDVETVGHRAGLALWTREDLERYPFLKAG